MTRRLLAALATVALCSSLTACAPSAGDACDVNVDPHYTENSHGTQMYCNGNEWVQEKD